MEWILDDVMKRVLTFFGVVTEGWITWGNVLTLSRLTFKWFRKYRLSMNTDARRGAGPGREEHTLQPVAST